MLTLTYGYKKPQTNDKGPIVFQALEDNIQKTNDHTHNGTDSAPLTPASVPSTQQTILSASWVADVVTGFFKQTVSMPPGLSVDNTTKTFVLATGEAVFLGWKKVTGITYEVYINDNTQTVTALYK